MRFWYDTEFLERGAGQPIIPISLGIVREDGEKLYLIAGEAPLEEIYDHEWLRNNVLKWLPVTIHSDTERPGGGGPLVEWDEDRYSYTEHVFARGEWQVRLEEFFGDGGLDVELWADFPSYDHVVLAQVWGRMVDLPKWMPQRTNCVSQLIDDWDLTVEWAMLRDSLAALRGPGDHAHIALSDAGWCREIWSWARRMKADRDGADSLPN